MSRKEITSMYTKSICFINSDTSLLKNSDSNNIFLSGFDSRGFLTYKFGSEKYQQEISSISLTGNTVRPRSVFNTNTQNSDDDAACTDDYVLGQGVYSTSSNSISINNSKFTYTWLGKFLNSLELRAELGYNINIQTDSDGLLNSGWFQYDPRTYLGYGFEGFGNPFIWNKKTQGTSFSVKPNDKVSLFSSYGVLTQDASEQSESSYSGFFSSDTESIFTSGIHLNYCCSCIPVKSCFIYQNINEGETGYDNTKYWTIPDSRNINSDTFSVGSITTRASSCLAQHIENDSKYTRSFTGLLNFGSVDNIEFNAAYTLSSINTTDGGDNAILSKWSLGINNISEKLSVGINIGTPTYLQSGTDDVSSDTIPFVIEANCLITLAGFNVPIFLDFMTAKTVGDSTYDDLTESPTFSGTGISYIFGIRPNKIVNFNIENNQISNEDKTILPLKGSNNEDNTSNEDDTNDESEDDEQEVDIDEKSDSDTVDDNNSSGLFSDFES